MQRYALPKEINPEKEQLDNKHWRKNITKQSYLPTRSSSRTGESSKTLINNNVQNRNNSFKKQNKSIQYLPSKRIIKNDIIIKEHSFSPSKKNPDDETEEKKKDLTLERYRKMLAKYESKDTEDNNNIYINSKELSVESLEEKPLNSSEDTEFKEKAKLVSEVHDKTTEINNRNDTSHSVEQINDKSKIFSNISQNSENMFSISDNISSSRQFSMTSTASKASISPSFRTLDELQAKLQSTLEDGDRILEENELECLKQENKQLNIDLEKMAIDNENLQEQLASYAELEKEFSECMIRLKKMTMVVNAKEKEVQELTKEREKSKDIIYRMRERTTDLVTKNNELFNSKLKLKYELEFIKEQMEVKTQELEKVIKEKNVAEKQVNELRNELNQVKKENENNENDEKKHYWGFRSFGF